MKENLYCVCFTLSRVVEVSIRMAQILLNFADVESFRYVTQILTCEAKKLMFSSLLLFHYNEK